MTPEQKLKHAILLRAVEMENIQLQDDQVTSENVDDLYSESNENWELQGVSMSRDKFKAALKVNGEYRYIGEFPSAESASFAYQLAKEKVLSAHHDITPADKPTDWSAA